MVLFGTVDKEHSQNDKYTAAADGFRQQFGGIVAVQLQGGRNKPENRFCSQINRLFHQKNPVKPFCFQDDVRDEQYQQRGTDRLNVRPIHENIIIWAHLIK